MRHSGTSRLHSGLIGLLALFVFALPDVPDAASGKARVMLVLDASGSMWGQIEGKNKIVIAREVIGDLTRQWDPAVELGLVAYGHRREGDCQDIEVLVPISEDSVSRVGAAVHELHPKGKTPLSDAVRRAAEHLRYEEEAASVILVTDGLETCNADPCAVAKALEESGVDFTAYVVGFDIREEESKSVRCIADNTGGQYFSAATSGELIAALGSVVEAARAPGTDRVLMALVEGGPVLEEGNAEFRFYASDATGGRVGDPVATNNGYGHVGFAKVPPGNYVVTVAYGLAQAEQRVEVTGEGRDYVIVLNAGIIRLRALLGEDTRHLRDELEWRVFPPEGATQLTFQHGPNAAFVLPPGRYRITSAVSGVKREAAYDVGAGDQLDVDVDLRGGTVRYRALMAAGGERALGPSFYWQAFAIAEDGVSRGERRDFSHESSGEFLLPAGRNLIAFEDKAIKIEQVVDVVPEQSIDLDLVMDAALLSFEFLDDRGVRLGGYPYWELFPAGGEGAAAKRLTYGDRAAGQVYVPAKPLVMRVKAGDRTQSWPLELNAGEKRSVQFRLE